MNTYGEVDVQTQIFLTSALVGGEWLALRPGLFTPEESAPGNHSIECWVAPGTVWTTLRRENSWPYWDSNSETSIVQPVAILMFSGPPYITGFIFSQTDGLNNKVVADAL
jgi:hypothetical protein